MRSTGVALLAIAVATSAQGAPRSQGKKAKGAVIRCKVDNKAWLSQEGEALFDCRGGGERFKVWCNPSDDAEYANRNIKTGVWKREGGNEGLVFDGGFTTCRRF